MKKTILLLLTILYAPFMLQAQCTEAKDQDMAKYKRLTETQDAQGCSQCAMLALYFCSAKYCAKPEDVRKVDAMITACKRNIKTMGEPYCCTELLNKQPQWGVGVNGSSSGSTTGNNPTSTSPSISSNAGSVGIVPGNSNNSNSNNQTYSGGTSNSNDDDLADILNTTAGVLDILSGGSGNGAIDVGSGDAADILNASTGIIQNIMSGDGSGTNYPSYSSAGNIGSNSTSDAINYVNQVVTQLGNSGAYTPSDLSTSMDIVNGVGSILSFIDEIDAEAERKRQAELQRQRQLEEIRQREEKARLEKLRIINNRKEVVNRIAKAKMPLTYPAVSNNEVYFYAYYTSTASLESNNPEISVTNVFAVSKYSDGSWPLLNRLTDKITYSTKYTGIQLAGYYNTRSEAEAARNNLIIQAKATAINTVNIQYSEKALATNANSGSSDFWETNYKKPNNSYYNTNTPAEEKPEKPVLDFWDNPIKP
jgi:hypothetical protein